MARKLIGKYLPDPHKVKSNRLLKVFGEWIHDPSLWHLTRNSVGRAFAVGLFCAFVPVPFQMFLAGAGAIIFRANLPLSVALVWTSNPVTMPFMFTFAYFVGAALLGEGSSSGFSFELSWEWLSNELTYIWQPFLLGCLVCGVISATLGNVGIRLLWRYQVSQNWKKRLRARQHRVNFRRGE